MHLILFILMAMGGVRGCAGKPNPETAREVPQHIEVDLVELTETLENPEQEKKKKAKEDGGAKDDGDIIEKSPLGEGELNCDNWFGGIGVMHELGSRTITNVYEGYPAYDAGIQVGDVIVSPPIGSIRGEPGTKVVIDIYRVGRFITFEIVRDRICLDEPDR